MHIDKDLVAASATPLVLAILAESESYGYAILKRVRALSGGELEWTDGMLYPLLHRLASVRVRDDGVANAAGRAAPSVLHAHRRRTRGARGPAKAVGGRHARAERRLAAGGGGGVTRRGADRGVARLRRGRARRQRPRRRRARGPSARPDRRPERGRPRRRGGVPGRREADGRRRQPVARVRARAQRPAVEAAPERRRRAGARLRRLARGARLRAWLRPSRSRSRGSPPASPTRSRTGCSRNGDPVRAAVPRRVLRPPAAAGRSRVGADRGAVRGRGARRQPLSVGRGLEHRDARRVPPARRAVVRRRLPVHGRDAPLARAAHGLRPLHGRVVHLLRADRARRRRAHGADRGNPRAHRRRRRPDRRVGDAVRRRGRRDRGRVARRVEAAGRGEHGAGARRCSSRRCSR